MNADSVISGVSRSIEGYNLFSYCFNNPINLSDETGNWPKWAKIALGVAAAVAAVAVTVATLGACPTALGGCRDTKSICNGSIDKIVPQRTIYQYKAAYYRVDEILFPEKPFIVIEYAETEAAAQNGVMEDTDPFPYNLSDDDIRKEIQMLLEL